MSTYKLDSQPRGRRAPPVDRLSAASGFTLVEIVVSMGVLFMGILMSGGLMLKVEQGATASERRYEDHVELGDRMETLKSEFGAIQMLPGNGTTFTTSNGNSGSVQVRAGPDGIARLSRVEIEVTDPTGLTSATIVTYLRLP